jgi:hypothetical protein
MAIIMQKSSDYGNKGLGNTLFLATYSQNIISASILANSCPKLKIFSEN